MIDTNSLLSSSESAALAQVSPSTVEQYAQFGLLKARQSEAGLRFRVADLLDVFHLDVAVLERFNLLNHVGDNETPLATQIERKYVTPEPQTASDNSTIEVMEASRLLRQQLDEIQRERDWLRERVEKLEAQSERNQMLLMSESDTVRRLVNQQKRKSFWAFALPWFGRDDSRSNNS